MIQPWRDIAIPHQDVLKGNFQQSELAAGIAQVQQGKVPPEHQDARQFFARGVKIEVASPCELCARMGRVITEISDRILPRGTRCID